MSTMSLSHCPVGSAQTAKASEQPLFKLPETEKLATLTFAGRSVSYNPDLRYCIPDYSRGSLAFLDFDVKKFAAIVTQPDVTLEHVQGVAGQLLGMCRTFEIASAAEIEAVLSSSLLTGRKDSRTLEAGAAVKNSITLLTEILAA